MVQQQQTIITAAAAVHGLRCSRWYKVVVVVVVVACSRGQRGGRECWWSCRYDQRLHSFILL